MCADGYRFAIDGVNNFVEFMGKIMMTRLSEEESSSMGNNEENLRLTKINCP
jgi:hypothetical protein